MSDYTVIFDGTANRPMGKTLFAPDSACRVAPELPPQRHQGAYTQAVRRLKGDPRFQDWFTPAQVLAATRIKNVHSALTNLQRTGELERERKALLRARGVQRYRWVR
ncbi:MAG: hypothetical protein RLY20_2482 [Verrucomicrobiota bacterium]|jgi:hypothetical protein